MVQTWLVTNVLGVKESKEESDAGTEKGSGDCSQVESRDQQEQLIQQLIPHSCCCCWANWFLPEMH